MEAASSAAGVEKLSTEKKYSGEVRFIAHIRLSFGLHTDLCLLQWRRAIEALEARAPLPPDGLATLVTSLQNRVKKYHSVRNFERKNGK